MRQELEHIRRGYLDRALPGHLEERLALLRSRALAFGQRR
jgi:hypothetical protein